MSNGNNPVIPQNKIDSANSWLVEFMQTGLDKDRKEMEMVRQKLKKTYSIIVGLSITMFILGILLLASPLVELFKNGGVDSWKSFSMGGLGIADLTALFLFKPIERIHNLMGDMTQISIAINSYQTQVSLRLLEADATNKPTLGAAAEHIKEAAAKSIITIQNYFESK